MPGRLRMILRDYAQPVASGRGAAGNKEATERRPVQLRVLRARYGTAQPYGGRSANPPDTDYQ
jgi:hypothetical protein